MTEERPQPLSCGMLTMLIVGAPFLLLLALGFAALFWDLILEVRSNPGLLEDPPPRPRAA